MEIDLEELRELGFFGDESNEEYEKAKHILQEKYHRQIEQAEQMLAEKRRRKIEAQVQRELRWQKEGF